MRRDCGWRGSRRAAVSPVGSAASLRGLASRRHVCSEILQARTAADRGQLLGAAAELVAQQALDQQPQLVILGLQFRHNLLQHLLQDSRIVRQGREIDLHNAMMIRRRRVGAR